MSTTTDRDFELRLLANLPETSDATVVDEPPTYDQVRAKFVEHPQYLRAALIDLVQLADDQTSDLAVFLNFDALSRIAQTMIDRQPWWDTFELSRLLADLAQALDEQREFGGDPGGVCDRLGLHWEAAADHLECVVESLLDRIVR